MVIYLRKKWGALMKKYRFGFDYYALILFVAMIAPTIFWSFVKAPDDVLRTQSVTTVLDTIATISQVIMIASLCVLINNSVAKPSLTPKVVLAVKCLMVYYFTWVLYYHSVVNPAIILLLTVPPCAAFLLYAIDRKNIIAVLSSVVFLVCHLIYGIINFII